MAWAGWGGWGKEEDQMEDGTPLLPVSQVSHAVLGAGPPAASPVHTLKARSDIPYINISFYSLEWNRLVDCKA